MISEETLEGKHNALVEMIASMASLNFNRRLQIGEVSDPLCAVAVGLNMLSEELEVNMVKRTLLEEVNKNLEQFAYTVAHDIRSPLNTTLGLITVLEAQLEGTQDETVNECLAMLRKTNERSVKLVAGILEYSKTNFHSLEPEDIDVAALLHDVTELHQVDNPVKLVTETEIPHVRFNRTALRQIFGNIIDNAVKHNDKPECVITVSCRADEQCYEFCVKDNGPGIEPGRTGHIFRLFENFRNEREDSYGIGLSIVKKLVTQGNGTIRVESEYGNGTAFIFTIPREGIKVIPTSILFSEY